MGKGGCMCVVGEKKKERQGVHGWWEKKKGNKKEKRNEKWGIRVWEKRESGKIKKKKNLKGKKLKWFYLYIHFIWCKVQNYENLFKGCL